MQVYCLLSLISMSSMVEWLKHHWLWLALSNQPCNYSGTHSKQLYLILLFNLINNNYHESLSNK
ncbi:MAG: hypothetical protein EZS26_000680 [Candidatus Ordinivivax streblomastigis]|uniref:Uncharacterized protein n=1 Tax=Candidatus Ordinivivax streblomastigis TaxID=2540710 RepID=A0A5M8P3L3_9BACT|nr:MAG: hypothetical protein EZS26_000680 [Candidatus Ordinivivax streblomastigis]